MENIVSSAKTDMFRIRINPVLRKQLEDVYGKNGLTLTDAVNVFFQQSLNAGGFPFEVYEKVQFEIGCNCTTLPPKYPANSPSVVPFLSR